MAALVLVATSAVASPLDDFANASVDGQAQYCRALYPVLVNRLLTHVELHGTPSPTWLANAQKWVVELSVRGETFARLGRKTQPDATRDFHEKMCWADRSTSDCEPPGVTQAELEAVVPADYRDDELFLVVANHQCIDVARGLMSTGLTPGEAEAVRVDAAQRAEARFKTAADALRLRYAGQPADARVNTQ